METKLLLACDLDRTIVPNGPEPLSDGAMAAFRDLISTHDILLAYVSGRDLGRVEKAIEEFSIPFPDFVIGDVGTTIYVRRAGLWKSDAEWEGKLSRYWGGRVGADVRVLLGDVDGAQPQESDRQSAFKLSFYVDAGVDVRELMQAVRDRLEAAGVRANIIYSFDQMKDVGLLDILPQVANKATALKHLADVARTGSGQVVFAGDSGNDVDVLVSGLHAILVANALPEVREEACARAVESGVEDRLYCARGGYRGMNGCYVAGILEGLDAFVRNGSIKLALRVH